MIRLDLIYKNYIKRKIKKLERSRRKRKRSFGEGRKDFRTLSTIVRL